MSATYEEAMGNSDWKEILGQYEGKVVHCKRSPYDVYIGRPSKWGNPYSHLEGTRATFRVKTRAEAIAKFREWILTQPELMAEIHTLKGKTLGCWCYPKSCHGEVLLELAATK